MTEAPLRYGRLCSLVYQLDKPIGTSFGDVEFYRTLLAEVSGEILEPAVGTGRILIPLLQSGLRVRGYDTSDHMLTICRDNCAAHGLDPVLFEADMVAFREPAVFDAVIIPAGSFALVTGRERALQALRNIRESLAPGGRLIVDVEPINPPAQPEPLRHWWHGADLITLTCHPGLPTDPGARPAGAGTSCGATAAWCRPSWSRSPSRSGTSTSSTISSKRLASPRWPCMPTTRWASPPPRTPGSGPSRPPTAQAHDVGHHTAVRCQNSQDAPAKETPRTPRQ